MKGQIFLAALILTACSRQSGPPANQAVVQAEMQTIDSTDPRPTVYDPPIVLTDEAQSPKPKNPFDAEKAIPLSPEDEKIRNSLPFTPAIAMDPVDGSKVSIRAATPVMEYKNKIYYFSSSANHRAFLANPDQFIKGLFSHM